MSTFTESERSADDGPWLFDRRTDLLAFGGSAALAVLLLGVGAMTGALESDVPAWTWIVCVLAIDVAHVWSTAFRVYLDERELRRRPLLYFGLPVLCWIAGAMAYAVSALTFWQILAYIAVFHFVRQQYGWVALYRRRAKETSALDRVIDTVAIYTATVYPLIYWHAHLPRRFHWFMQGDFVTGIASSVATWLAPVYWAVLLLFVGRQAWRWLRGRAINPGKIVVVLTTWLCWWLGVMVFDGDFAFTVTNVVIHGVPYFVLTYRYGRSRANAGSSAWLRSTLRFGVLSFITFVLTTAFLEEALWDRYVWHDREWLFGVGQVLSEDVLIFLVPLLALPQAVHYALDGFIWRSRSNPHLRES